MFQLLIAARRSLKIIPSARYEFSSVEVIPKIIKPVTNRALFEDAWVSKLSRRSVISVRGQDSTAILQNVGTTDMRKFEDVDRAALYTSFLSVKGKMMFDAIVAKPKLAFQTKDDMEYWVDVAEGDAEGLVKHLKKYSMRKNVKIEDISHVIKSFSIQTLGGMKDCEPEGHFFKEFQDEAPMFESEEFKGCMETDVCAFVDPRTSANGVRVLCAEESFEPEEGVNIIDDQHVQYNIARMIHGIPESGNELNGQFPLNMHLDHLNGVAFDKGCYIGQELTQRTHYTGVVRKIALPYLVLSDATSMKIDMQGFSPISYVDRGFDINLKGETILDAKGKKLGKVFAQQNNVGIALVDLARLNLNGPNHEYKLGDFRAYLWQPMWLDMQLQPEGYE